MRRAIFASSVALLCLIMAPTAAAEQSTATGLRLDTTSFTTDGLYTGSYSYSGTTSTVKSKPLTAASANTTLGGSAFRSRYQLFHA